MSSRTQPTSSACPSTVRALISPMTSSTASFVASSKPGSRTTMVQTSPSA